MGALLALRLAIEFKKIIDKKQQFTSFYRLISKLHYINSEFK